MMLALRTLEQLPIKLRRSAGIAVTAAVHRLIARGNAARSRGEWHQASEWYRAALARDPALAHIWVQLGHALNEAGDLAAAAAAYRQAATLAPADPDPRLHLGHTFKRRGDLASATSAYFDAARLDPGRPEAAAELFALLERSGDVVDMKGLQHVLDAETGSHLSATSANCDGGTLPTGDPILFDVSDLLAYFRHARLPTGIQRVQLETIASAMRSGANNVRICCFQEPRDEWIEIPPALFLELCRLSVGGEEREWTSALTRTLLQLNMGSAIEFPVGAFLVNLGTSWWLPNYFLFIRRAKLLRGVRYVPFVHDMIPLVRSELCPPLLVQDFIAWAIGVFEHADFFLVNSEATLRDLLAVASYLGKPLDPARIAVIRLDADHRKSDTVLLPSTGLRRWALDSRPYVLLVSTIEPRKNHMRAFYAWAALLRRHGPHKVPRLVCVGNRGWMNEPIHQQLAADESLRAHVLILSSIADDELALLYTNCLFTLYPSQYEGWGLPVTEALCHGKVPLAARISSIPEAGGPFADYFTADSVPELTAALERLIFDSRHREARERLIAENFRPRSWQSIAEQIAACIVRWSETVPATPPAVPRITPGAWHPTGRSRSVQIWPGMESTEAYRAGANWWGRDDDVCWTKAGGATLWLGLPADHRQLRLYLRVSSMPRQRCDFSIDVNGWSDLVTGELRADETKWLAVDLPPHPQGRPLAEVEIRSNSCEDLSIHTADPRTVSIGVIGFFVCEADDHVARTAFLEAAALGNVEDLSVTREPLVYPRFRQLLEQGAFETATPPPLVAPTFDRIEAI